MTYSVGSTIVDDDYNIFATGNAAGSGDNSVANINTLWGTGTANFGYGQTTTVSAVSAGSTITATQWATLLSRMTSLGQHQGTSITAISNPSAGDTIAAYGALAANITGLFASPARLNAAGSGSDAAITSGTTATWNSSQTLVKTFTFSSANTLRYFFNAGGMLRFSWSRSGGSSNSQNTSWTNLLSAFGTIVFTGSAASKSIDGNTLTGTTKVGGSGSTSTLRTDLGIQDLSGNTSMAKQSSSAGDYTANNIDVQANISGAVVTITTILTDGSGGVFDSVDGTLNQVSTIRQPSTTHIADTWGGGPTQNSPSWSGS
jgi:hypothetical protein